MTTITPRTTKNGPDAEECGNPLDVHVEVYVSTVNQETIRVRCWCEIGRTHTYEEAVA